MLADFADILSIDSSIIHLADALQRIFKGVSTPAAIKLNLVYSCKKGLKRLKTAPAIRSKNKLLRVGKWVKDALVLLDKAYYCLDSLQQVHQLGGKFITPLKNNANPDVISVAGWEDFDEPVGFQTVQGCFNVEDSEMEGQLSSLQEVKADLLFAHAKTASFQLNDFD